MVAPTPQIPDKDLLDLVDALLEPSQQTAEAAGTDDRRHHQRSSADGCLIVLPVLPDGAPDWERRRSARLVDVSRGGIGLEVDRTAGDLPSALLVGVEDEDGRTHFAGVTVRHTRSRASGCRLLGTAFGGPAAGLIKDGTLRPQLQAGTLTFEYALPQEVLDQWIQAGVLTRRLCDRVQVCPRCRSLPTFRDGCRKCGSACVQRAQLIHHFACAHVDEAARFQSPAGLVCPKCHTSRLVVAADFEYLHGPFSCLDCRWDDPTLESIGHCLKCDHRFAAADAAVEDLFIYSGNQLHWRHLMTDRRSCSGPVDDSPIES